MPRPKSFRRRVYEAAAQLTVGRVPKDEWKAIEERMNEQWYGSGQTDFSFYSHPDYRYLLLHSWIVASQYDVERVTRMELLRSPKVILDFHGGIGMSAAYLAHFYPEARVYSHSEVGWHRDLCAKLAEALGLDNMFPTAELLKADVVLAQETMEHFRDPIQTLFELYQGTHFSQYLDGSSFTFDSPGHFNPFFFGTEEVPRKMMKRKFNAFLHGMGFVRPWEDPLTGIGKQFNGRPALWSRPLDENDR